jgi:methionine-rich copper-binding protein CopC
VDESLRAAVVICCAASAAGHAFQERSEPRVGATLSTAPEQVRIWFDSELEHRFSEVHVFDGNGRAVDRGHPRVDPKNRRLLQVSLPSLAAGGTPSGGASWPSTVIAPKATTRSRSVAAHSWADTVTVLPQGE